MLRYFLSVVVLLLAATPVFAQPDPIQVQAGLNAKATPSEGRCDYMPQSCTGFRSASMGTFPSGKNLTGINRNELKRLGLTETKNGEAEWEAYYATTLNQLVAEKKIVAPTYEAYAAAYGKPRDAANPMNNSVSHYLVTTTGD